MAAHVNTNFYAFQHYVVMLTRNILTRENPMWSKYKFITTRDNFKFSIFKNIEPAEKMVLGGFELKKNK